MNYFSYIYFLATHFDNLEFPDFMKMVPYIFINCIEENERIEIVYKT